MSTELTICIVLFKPDLVELFRTFDALLVAIKALEASVGTRLLIVDNSPDASLDLSAHPLFSVVETEIASGQGNVGFGRANNIALKKGVGTYHLVLNPDVEMAPDALIKALHFMDANPQCGLLSPAATAPDGRTQYLCKRYPSLFDLFLRGFMPASVRQLFRKRLDRYEMKEETGDDVFWDPPIVSGCFMLFRGDVFRTLGGFDPRYMLYFEDFDISLRAGRQARIAYVPDVKIVHGGGNAAQKGWWHIAQFLKSAAIFFPSHGIKLF
ncbi:glycosyltransferase [Daeguia caeni]|uniref:Glycosyltransferase n=1 Tax=Daeguia caeni TaxID=439612 RepID=A0ABV9H2N4_9HYPH